MRTFLLAVVFASALTAGAMAQTSDPSILAAGPSLSEKATRTTTPFTGLARPTSTGRNARGSMTYGETWRRPYFDDAEPPLK